MAIHNEEKFTSDTAMNTNAGMLADTRRNMVPAGLGQQRPPVQQQRGQAGLGIQQQAPMNEVEHMQMVKQGLMEGTIKEGDLNQAEYNWLMRENEAQYNAAQEPGYSY